MAGVKSSVNKTSVIIEIGSDWLKIIQAEPHSKGPVISRVHLEKISADSAGLSQTISAALKKGRFARIPVIGCLPRQAVNVRMMELPSTDHDEIADMVDLQIGKLTPYSKDEIVSDYRIVGSGRAGYTRAMLNIVQRSVIRDRFYLLEEAGVEVARMSTSSEGLSVWCGRALGQDSTVAVLDVDSSYSDLTVMVNGVLVFTKSIKLGANILLREFDRWKEELCLEVRRSLETCQGELPGVRVSKLFVAGAGRNIKGLADYLSTQLSLPVKTIDSLKVARKVPKKPALSDAKYASASLTPLMGMALDPGGLEFNLVPDSVMSRRNLEKKAKSLTVLSMLVMSTMVFASVYTAVRLHFHGNIQDSLNTELSDTRPRVKNLKKMNELIGVINSRKDRSFSAVNIFAVLHPLVPEGMTFDSIKLDMTKNVEQVSLDGLAELNPSIRTLVKNLEQSNVFADVKQVTKMERKMFRFQIICSLEKK
ncbi:MAG: pilus assembly protein PilM [Kiritimatiellae bacterium]|nr:pilus assembly protein PilM [Kiritimatiellia bacterium]